MIGAPYWRALTGRAQAGHGGRAQTGLEHADASTAHTDASTAHTAGNTAPLPAGGRLRPGDASLIDRCGGPTLDVGSGPGRLIVALGERGVPALGIDVTPQSVQLAQSAGALALQRDVFSTVPGTGRWMIVLLADGSIGIGGDPVALLSRVAELLAPRGQALVEVQPPGREARREQVVGYLGADQLDGIASEGRPVHRRDLVRGRPLVRHPAQVIRPA